MNPETPQTPREKLEARLTALLMGELKPEEAAAVRALMAADPALSALHERLRKAVELLREASALPEQPAPPAPAQLSSDRREKLLAHFKTAAPAPASPSTPAPIVAMPRRNWTWIIPTGIAAAVIALLGAGLLLPSFTSVERRNSARMSPAFSYSVDASVDSFPNEASFSLQPGKNGGNYLQKSPSSETSYIPGYENLELFCSTLETPGLIKGGSGTWLYAPTAPETATASPLRSGVPNLEFRGGTLETPGSGAGLAGTQITRNEFQRSQSSSQFPLTGLIATGTATPYVGAYAGGTFQTLGADQFGAFQKDASQADQKRPFLYGLNGQSDIALNGVNTYSGGTTITGGGTLTLSGGSTFGAGSADNDRGSNVTLGSSGDTATVTGSNTLTIHAGPVSFPVTLDVKGGTPNSSNTHSGVTITSGAVAGTVALGAVSGSGTVMFGAAFGSHTFDTGVGGYPETTAQPARTTTAFGNGAFSLTSPDGVNNVTGTSAPTPALAFAATTNSLNLNVGGLISGANEGVAAGRDAGDTGQGDRLRYRLRLGNNDTASANEPSTLGGTGTSDGAQRSVPLPSGPVRIDYGMPLQAEERAHAANPSSNMNIGYQFGSPQTPSPTPAPRVPVFGKNADPNATLKKAQGRDAGNSNPDAASKDQWAGGYWSTKNLSAGERMTVASQSERKEQDAAKAIPREPPAPADTPQPEVLTRDNAFSTFSLNVSDVSFKLAAASLEQGRFPDPSSVRSEEFVNAFDYRDPEPAPGAPLAFASERARYPFAQNRDLLRFSVKTAAAGRQPGRPLNIVLLLDKSGSMERADRVNIVREALRVLAAQLQQRDKLSIVTFARTPRLWADGVAGDKVGDMIKRVGEITPEGGTNLEAALDLGYQTALRHYTVGGISRVVLFTDGAANLGDVDPAVLTRKVEAHRKKGVALDCFGIGWEGYNDDLLEQLTRNGDGRYGFINTPEEAAANFAAQLAGALQVAASDVKTQVEFNPRRVIAYRQIGYAKHQLTKEQFRDNTVNAAQIGAAESGNALYVVEVDPHGEGDLATVRVRFRVPGTTDYREHEWAVPFNGNAQPLEQSTPALRLAGTAAAFSEMLAASPYAAEVTTDRLLGLLNGVPAIYGADPRPKKLEWMIRQVKNLSGH